MCQDTLNTNSGNKKRVATPYKKNCYFRLALRSLLCLLASDFPTENPRKQARNFSYTKPLCFIMTKPLTNDKIL